jgi:hypothetical protein
MKNGHANLASPSHKEAGSALIYILIAIALLAALTASFMQPSSQQTSSQNTFKTAAAMQGQVDIIRSAIQECVLSYPRGDICIDNGTGEAASCPAVAVTDNGANRRYPLKPNSTYFTGADIGPAAGRLVSDIRCPGDQNGADENDHDMIFGGASGKYLAPPPDLFNDWQYYNGIDGVYFWTETDKSDAFILSALEKLDDNFSECEADVIDATGGAEDLDSAATAETQCPSGSVCFRVRLITSASAEWNGDGDGDEGGC